MNLPPDQLKLRLQAAIATLKRLTDEVYLGEETHVQLCRAKWRLAYELALLEETEQQRASRG